MFQEEKNQIIQNLQTQINSLISIHKRCIEENEQLFKEKQELYKQNQDKANTIIEQQKKIDNLKISNAFVFTNDENNENLSEMKHEAKIKINRIVREIDKCVSLLNNLN